MGTIEDGSKHATIIPALGQPGKLENAPRTVKPRSSHAERTGGKIYLEQKSETAKTCQIHV